MAAASVVLQLQSQVAPQIAATVSAYQQLSAAEQKAAQSASVYARTQAQVALADAKTATEEQRLAVQTANAAKAQDQASLASLRLANAQQKAGTGTNFAAETASAFKSQLAGIVGPAALATAAVTAFKAAADLTVAGENNNRVERSFASLAQQAGTTGDVVLAALRKASGNEISDLNLELAVNKGLLLGVANSAQDFGAIMEIARDRAAKMGITTTQAFDDITTGIGRESPRILDNLGIIVDLDAAHQAYAQSVGKTVDQLSKAERIEALRNAVIAQGKGTLDANTTALNDQTNSYARLGVSAENAKNKIGSFLSTATQPIAGQVATGLDRLFSGSAQDIADADIAVTNFNRALAGLPPLTIQAQQSQQAWTRSVIEWIGARERQLGLLDTPAPSSGGGGSFTLAPDPAVLEQAIAQAKRVGGAFDEDRQALGLLQTVLGTTSGEMQRAAQASVNDAAAKETQTAKTALLTAESNNAVNSFLALNPQIDASGIAALVAAGKLDAEIGRLAALRVEAAGAKDELIKLNNANAQQKLDGLIKLRSSEGVGSGRGGGSDALAEGQAFADALGRQAAAAKKAADDQIALAKATGDTVRARKLLNQQLADAKKSGDIGEQARVIDALNALDKKGASGRISAAESTALRLSDIARTSGDDRARIERENQEKLRRAQEDFDVRSARSQEDFDEKRRGLLARGQRAQAAELAKDFAKDKQRAQEDFDRQRRRTNQDNAEALGDQSTRVGNSVESVNARTAARGGTAASLPATPGGGSAATLPSAPGRQAATLAIQGVINLDGKAVGAAVWPTIEVLVDDELSVALRAIGVPNSGQSALGG